jgi:superoxide dismutase, Cu-Zn family
MTLQRGTRVSMMVFAVGLAALAGPGWRAGGPPAQAQAGQAIASLYTQAGDAVGTVTFTQEPADVMVRAEVANLPPGFHGFHVHTNGVCDPATQFASAGGHLNLGAGALPGGGMSGDMTNLYVKADGTGTMTLRVDRFAVTDLLADGGRAVIVHADPDNFRNIPSRYGVTPDQTTLETGDAGVRIACGVIQAS